MGSALPVAATIADVRRAVRAARAEGKAIGLAPTMGALHAGHARLIEECRREADFVVVSIFVNPTQFGPSEDFRRYPRTLDDDLARCASAGATLAFAPTVEEMYPTGSLSTYVEVPGLSDVLEGASRPGHFRGVATVVLKLLQIVGPDLASFGRKDFQQLLVIRRMVADLDVPVRIQGVETVREADELALSSRNRYLDQDQRRAALVLSRALRRAQDAVRGGERDADRVRQTLRSAIESEALARLDYAEVADPETLAPLTVVGPDRPGVALVAARVGPARLIDNAALPG
jgi:pantoate--beta-alanine ligase